MNTLNQQFEAFFATYTLTAARDRLITLQATEPHNPEIKYLEQEIANAEILTSGLITDAENLSKAVKEYFAQTSMARYQATVQGGQNIESGELDVSSIHKEEQRLLSNIQKMKGLVATHNEAHYQTKINHLAKEINKIDALQKKGKSTVSLTTKKGKLEAEKSKLEAIITDNRVSQLKQIGASFQSPEPIDFEEMTLLHSITNLFQFNDSPPPIATPTELVDAMQKKIVETESDLAALPPGDPDINNLETRLKGMRELLKFYQDYQANTTPITKLSFPDSARITKVWYELPQQYRDFSSKPTSGTTLATYTSFEIPPQSDFYKPKSATAHFISETGAHLIITPKSEIFLPSRAQFMEAGIVNETAFKASVSLFTDKYLEMYGNKLHEKKITVNFTGPASQAMKEAFVRELIEKRAVKKIKGTYQIDNLELQSLELSCRDLKVFHVFQEYQTKHSLNTKLFSDNKPSSDFSKMKKGLHLEKDSTEVSTFIAKGVNEFKQEIETTDIQSLRNKTLKGNWHPLRSDEENFKNALCIVAAYDTYPSKTADAKYKAAIAIIEEKLKQKYAAVPNFDLPKELKTFIEVRIHERQIAQARRPGLAQ